MILQRHSVVTPNNALAYSQAQQKRLCCYQPQILRIDLSIYELYNLTDTSLRAEQRHCMNTFFKNVDI